MVTAGPSATPLRDLRASVTPGYRAPKRTKGPRSNVAEERSISGGRCLLAWGPAWPQWWWTYLIPSSPPSPDTRGVVYLHQEQGGVNVVYRPDTLIPPAPLSASFLWSKG